MPKLKQGAQTKIKQLNVLNLLKIFIANIECLQACRMKLSDILSANEINMLSLLQFRQLTDIKLFASQLEKQDKELNEEEILQKHLVNAAKALMQILAINLD